MSETAKVRPGLLDLRMHQFPYLNYVLVRFSDLYKVLQFNLGRNLFSPTSDSSKVNFKSGTEPEDPISRYSKRGGCLS